MARILRILIIAAGFLAVLFIIRYVIRSIGQSGGAGKRDASKEVKNASFKSEDVEDAKFKDVK